MTKPFRKVLIANRGEIAVRIARSCREQGLRTVAVYSEADRTALHVRAADEACAIGPTAAAASYLSVERLLDAARRSGADAVHPGYGFLSEHAGFAAAVVEAGLVWIGPPPEAIRAMGDKTTARALMSRAGVPVAPGARGAVETPGQAARIADRVGYPVLIKAAAGGGGKGMRVVHHPAELARAFEMARSEALAAFGDGRVFVEKYITEPRHIEIQVLADAHGHAVHLFERECSIQRRHQKIIEEAPSAVLTPAVRARMGEAAVEAARSCGYVGAGTVEFLVDRDLNFYFMEMNTRLQVEHPVTEWITGHDLVALQLRVAAGEALPFGQADLAIHGHAVECRIYAEDPYNHFLPDPGRLLRHAPPAGFGVRVDAGVEAGADIQIHYDPMISKLSTWGRTRDEAIRRMDRALAEYEIAGVRTTIPFCRFVMGHEAFREGRLTTHFVADHFHPEPPADAEADALAALAAVLVRAAEPRSPRPATPPAPDRWLQRRWQG